MLAVTRIKSEDAEQLLITLPGLGVLRGTLGRTAWTERIIYQFQGVHFAESPSGKNRFKPPIEKVPWNGIKDATKHGIACPGSLGIFENFTDGIFHFRDLEDCLHLSVYSSNLDGSNPVIFFIHGGHFERGSASNFLPDYLLEKDIVLVVTQYRLGPLGFLSTKTPEISGNVAMLDVILALEWVQRYISHFGGNPAQVTISGESAGSVIASALTISPAVREGLFQRGILQSGTVLSPWGLHENPVQKAINIAQKAKCFTSSLDDINKCFMDMSLRALLKATNHEVFALTLQDLNNVIPHKVNELISRKRIHYPLMGGVTKHDGLIELSIFYPEKKSIFENSKDSLLLIDSVLQGLQLSDDYGLESLLLMNTLFTQEQLLNGNFTEMFPGIVDMCNIVFAKVPMLRFLQLNAKLNSEHNFLYTFDYKGENTLFSFEYMLDRGVYHFDDMLYLFPWVKLNENDTKIAKIMVDLWTSFAITGVPQSDGIQKWPPLTKIIGPYLHIDTVPVVDENFLNEFTVTIKDKDMKIIRKN